MLPVAPDMGLDGRAAARQNAVAGRTRARSIAFPNPGQAPQFQGLERFQMASLDGSRSTLLAAYAGERSLDFSSPSPGAALASAELD